MKHSITDISGIGESTAALLAEHGIDSIKVLRKGGVKKLCLVPGFGEARATRILAAARMLKDSDKAAGKAAKQEAKEAEKADNKAKKANAMAAKADKALKKAAKQAAKAAKKASKKTSESAKKKGKKK